MKKTIKFMALMLALTVSLAACGGGNNTGKNAGTNAGTDADANAGEGEAGGTQQEAAGPKYPALELPDVTGLATAEAAGNGAKYSYPADQWTFDEDNGQLFYNDTLEASAKVNATVRFEAADTVLTEKDLAALKEGFSGGDLSFMEAKHAEFVSVDGAKVAYLDVVITDLETYVDMIIEQAGFSDEDLESYGGRDGLLEMIPPTNQLMFYFNVDGDLYSLSGVYFDDAQRDAMMKLFATVLPTVVKG